ncbi:MAG TPA: nucleotide exchange factor GrpE [Candidatus Binataceae bacterium]|nr:nucleotide exchange factor GrpE [Candidatus Binataceae bacterium]
MSKHKDEKHRHHESAAEWSLGHDERKPASDKPADAAERPIELSPEDLATPQSPETAGLSEQLADKDREIAELKDKYLRALADTENIRKRMRQQSEDTVRLQRENLLRDLLPITDNLERAVEAASGGGNGKPIVEGVEMVLRALLDFLRTNGVIPRESVGRPFDPQFHEAVDHVESVEHPPNTVISEFHRGYQVGERVLRPARVAVAKAPARDGPSRKNGEGGGVENN